MAHGKLPHDKNSDPEGQAVLKRLCRLDRRLAAEVNSKTAKLICLRAAKAEVKRLALARKAEQRRRGGPGGDACDPGTHGVGAVARYVHVLRTATEQSVLILKYNPHSQTTRLTFRSCHLVYITLA
jgi:hypothetical protein